jgi:hypothetical protein
MHRLTQILLLSSQALGLNLHPGAELVWSIRRQQGTAVAAMIMYETRGLGTQNSTNYDAAYGDVKFCGCNRHAEALVEPPRRAESAT